MILPETGTLIECRHRSDLLSDWAGPLVFKRVGTDRRNIIYTYPHMSDLNEYSFSQLRFEWRVIL